VTDDPPTYTLGTTLQCHPHIYPGVTKDYNKTAFNQYYVYDCLSTEGGGT